MLRARLATFDRAGADGRRLFDLRADPREVQPLARDPSAEERLLDSAADPGEFRFPARFEELDPERREQLDALGYGGAKDE